MPTPAEKPPLPNRDSYIWAIVVLSLIGMLLVVSIIALRPEMDPLVVLGAVMAGLAPTSAAIMAYIKAQETHLSVNSRLDAFIEQSAKIARTEGIAAGVVQEKGREKERDKGNAEPAMTREIAIETIKDGIETIEDGTDLAKSGIGEEGDEK